MSSASEVLERIAHACKLAGRNPAEVALLPVSKGQSEENIRRVMAEETRLPRVLGESYLPELEAKHLVMADEFSFHYIGRLQSRKLRKIAERVAVLHALCREKELQQLSELKASGQPTPSFYIQVNISAEEQKLGVAVELLPKLLESIEKSNLMNSCLGLMCLPSSFEKADERQIRREFSALRELRDRVLPAARLNMGMSTDFEWAIAEGSNLLRIGSALFGERR